VNPSTAQIAALVVFLAALLHVFLASRVSSLARRFPGHAGIFHLLGEVEVVFGVWAMILFCLKSILVGTAVAISDLEVLDFGEPLFVFVVMVVAGSRPVLQAASLAVETIARLLPFPRPVSFALAGLGATPLLGSFISEPAAMTIAALLLRDSILTGSASTRVRYAAVAVLFVNISIGGVLTSYAAPPVLMVAERWGWDTRFMAGTFGLRAVAAVLLNAAAFAFAFRRDLSSLPARVPAKVRHVPWGIVAVHLLLLAGIVLSSHHTVLFVGIFLLFLGLVQAHGEFHSPLLLREGLLVGFFLAGLVVLGSPQAWWLGPLVARLGNGTLYLGAVALTSVVDNAALTYLGSLIPGTSESFRYFLVAGAVVGGGLTVIANAPNPAGASLLREHLPGKVLANGKLFLYALPPTLVALLAFAFR
jgi:hypothetical protein